MKVDRYKTHDIELVIDRFTVKDDADFIKRLESSLTTAMEYGEDAVMVYAMESEKTRFFSRNLMCPSSGIAYPQPEPNTFSFNSPKGMCQQCKGLGIRHEINRNKIIPDDSLSIEKGGLAPLGTQKKQLVI
jgi:excinuclease ABC subunit A